MEAVRFVNFIRAVHKKWEMDCGILRCHTATETIDNYKNCHQLFTKAIVQPNVPGHSKATTM